MFSPFLHPVGSTNLTYQYALQGILDWQRRFHDRLLEDLRGLWKSYAALRDRAKGDPSLAFLADLRFNEMRSTTSQFGMQSTLTLLREADPKRCGVTRRRR